MLYCFRGFSSTVQYKYKDLFVKCDTDTEQQTGLEDCWCPPATLIKQGKIITRIILRVCANSCVFIKQTCTSQERERYSKLVTRKERSLKVLFSSKSTPTVALSVFSCLAIETQIKSFPTFLQNPHIFNLFVVFFFFFCTLLLLFVYDTCGTRTLILMTELFSGCI